MWKNDPPLRKHCTPRTYCDDWEPVIDRLLKMNDPASARLAFEFLRRVGLFGVPDETSIHTVLAFFWTSPESQSPG